ncbi:MAG TPA: lysophospholipid acyltransferase family protein [Sphingobacteriaceae bacterium]|nr:lysophospholipid acyltransferase family protein [Sphingobacteriaceae bacterium]
MTTILKKIHQRIYLISVGFFFLVMYPAFYFYSRKQERYKTLNKWRSALSFLTSASVGILYRYHYQTKIDWSKPYILCPNHSSNLDISALTILAKGEFAFIGKDELLSNPLTGLFFRTIDISFNRDSKIGAYRAFKKGEEYLKNGMSLIIFPEGKISTDYPPVLHEFKNGPFRLAIEQQIPIIPVSIKKLWEIMWDDGKKHGSQPGICHICVHRPIETTGMVVAQADELRDKVFGIINQETS